MEDKLRFEIPRRLEIIAFLLLIVTALLIRLNHLSADPPPGLTTSQDVYTDPAQYTSYARNFVLFGAFNPLHDFRLIFFLKSVTTVLAMLVFKLFGVGFAQGNAVGLIFSFSTIVLFYFAVRKMAGNVASLFFLIFISLDYNQIFYGRLSFLENSMNFFAALAFVIMLYSRHYAAGLTAGLFLGAGIFFSKIIGVIYLFPFACFAIYQYFHDFKPDLRGFLKKYLSFILGFAVVGVFWLYFSYLPMARSVTGYVEEQAISLYGAPKAFESFADFLYKYVTFGFKSELFGRMPMAAFLAWGMIVLFLYRAGRRENWRKKLYGINPGMVFLIAMIGGAYGALMIWNYRPLRYQTLLIYPIYSLAGIFMTRLLSQTVKGIETKAYRLFPVVLMAALMVPMYQLLRPYAETSEASFYLSTEPYIFIGAAAVATGIILVGWKFLPIKGFLKAMNIRRGVVLLTVLAILIPGSINYLNWSGRATFCTVANSRDLSLILSPEAVISGPYAADFTQENRFFNFIHMFGVANVDTAFFRRYPITHILVDKSNEETARKDYPQIMDSARFVAHYYVGGRKVKLFRVAGLTGNLEANQYHWSYYEIALQNYVQNKIDSGHYYMKRFQLKNPDNLSANYISARMAGEFKMYEEAEYFYKKAIAFSPTDFHLHLALGAFYIRMFRESGQSEYRVKGLEELEKARGFDPESERLNVDIANILNLKDVSDEE
ncbi:membrane hypothetical protein [Candidatus Zixiibacteriota bacterium]|nr:membrane hypothetical protein [candidate division Zixibacteria bacterium]